MHIRQVTQVIGGHVRLMQPSVSCGSLHRNPEGVQKTSDQSAYPLLEYNVCQVQLLHGSPSPVSTAAEALDYRC